MQPQKVNIKVIIKVIGVILVVEGVFILSCLPVSLYFGGEDFYHLLLPGLFVLITGAFLWFKHRSINQRDASKKDGYLIVVIIWIVMSAFGALPFFISGYIPNYTDAFFETISGFSTTGATILTDIEVVPKGILFWRSLTQWIGGMGIIVLTVAILPFFGFGGMNMFMAEAPGLTKDKLHPRIMATARRLWVIYVALTIAEVSLLLLGGMNWYESVSHSLTTMSTGGFSPKNTSITEYSPYIQYVITVFMAMGGISFILHYMLIKRRFSNIIKNDELWFYIILIAASTLFIMISLYVTSGGDLEKSFRDSVFQVVSIITTTGFTNTDYMIWPSFIWFLLFLLMFAGGMTGSTAGGLKSMRHLILFKNVRSEFIRLIHPSAVIPVRFMGKAVPRSVIMNILSLFLIYMVAFAAGVFILMVFGLEFTDSCGSVTACLNAVGPGLGSTGAIGNYAHLHDVSKWTLSALMLLGRLEFIAVFVIFSRGFWKN